MTRFVRYVPKPFELAPEGIHPARLVEIKDIKPGPNGRGEEKERVRFSWELKGVFTSNGDPMRVFDTYNLSLHPKSFLCGAIRGIIGREPGEEFDIDSLLGVERDLALKHNEGDDGKTYCNIVAYYRKKTAAETAEEQRVQTVTQRVIEAGAKDSHKLSYSPPPPDSDAATITDEAIPF